MSQPAEPPPAEAPRPRPSPQGVDPGADIAPPDGDLDPWWRKRRWLLAGGLAVLAVIVAVITAIVVRDGSPAAPAPLASPAARTGDVGQTLSFASSEGSGRLTLNSAERLVGTDFAEPPKNGSYLVIDVTLEVSQGTAGAGPFDWEARNSDGSVYAAVPAGLTGDDIDASDLGPGERTRGKVAFDVPVGALTVTFTSLSGSPLATFSVPAEP
jgi:Domain of unknown function (DUF4352)